MQYLLDTNILIDFLLKKEKAKVLLKSLPSGSVAVSSVTVAEIYAGARPNEYDDIHSLLSSSIILPLTSEVAKLGGELMKQYRPKCGIDLSDALIAATARHHNLEIKTLNIKHFQLIFPNLQRPY